MSFKDHFSGHADIYAAARPDYPPELFAWLASLCSRHELAWDCATGNGQAALGLAHYFRQVVATDASAAQLGAAIQHAAIDYRCQPAEQALDLSGPVDLVTVAQALHWFETASFYETADRSLGEDGVLAVWCYQSQQIESAVDTVIDHLYTNILGEFWPYERTHVETSYRHLDFPYPLLTTPDFQMERQWTLAQQLSYLYSWSATQRYLQARGKNPIMLVMEDLRAVWSGTNGDPDSRLRTVRWPLTVLVGRKPKSV